jgi:glycosyltransferase involved in cell wall biosynthesis
VDVLVANSSYIAERIRKAWGRVPVVIHPPVDVSGFPLCQRKQDYFLVASRMVPYKRVDLIAEAFRHQPHRRLVVVGDGPCQAQVRAAAGGAPNIELRGHVAQAELVALMQGASACLHAAEEDFGIALVEAQSCGTPLIAYGRGGARDIVRIPPAADPTGVLFAQQTVESVLDALTRFDASRGAITPQACHHNAMRFTRERFCESMRELVAHGLEPLAPSSMESSHGSQHFRAHQSAPVRRGTPAAALSGGHHRPAGHRGEP